MSQVTSQARPRFHGPIVLAGLIGLAFALRALAAVAVDGYVRTRNQLCIFPDTNIYVHLADTIIAGGPYQVLQFGIPHRAIRTPGYPLFLAACRSIFGTGSLLPVRVIQAALGAVCVWLIERVVRQLQPIRAAALFAAGLVAIEPYTVGISVLVLSEALFIPLMLASLWGMTMLWANGDGELPRGRRWTAIVTGLTSGAAILVRPSWALFIPFLLAAWLVGSQVRTSTARFQDAALVVLGVVVVMSPWWVRNARVFHRFVPTVLWVGASLYDGLNPAATGGSDMRFTEDPDLRTLDELKQDSVLRDRALDFARRQPLQAVRLAAIKIGRFWSPWPNAENLRFRPIALASALVTLPLFGLILLGFWACRGDLRALVLLAGPLLYFCVLHMVFVSSVRYRIPGLVPALGLAAIGFARYWPAKAPAN
jgi:4-amino-4-deoxy-L-arabinose transferase-like glycosyltransferase